MAAMARMEVVEARNLVPKDGTGTSSPYARADFDGQRRKTRTVVRDLNLAWNEALEFDFPPAGVVDPVVAGEPLEVAVLHDIRVGPTRRNNFLGRVRLDARQFVRKGEEALIYFPLEKNKGFLSSFIKRHVWDEFVKIVTSEEALAKAKKFLELAKRNELKHNLGMTGYAGKREKWRQLRKGRRIRCKAST